MKRRSKQGSSRVKGYVTLTSLVLCQQLSGSIAGVGPPEALKRPYSWTLIGQRHVGLCRGAELVRRRYVEHLELIFKDPRAPPSTF